MGHNEGAVDRWIRVLVGIGVVSLVFVGPRTQWGWLGALLIATGLFGYCPMYALFGWSSCHRPDHRHA